ncbi:MAG: hypothetical protein IKF36_06355 [Bacilli bacterium]|nr:hypothetical protein [Bacilli bacterium]
MNDKIEIYKHIYQDSEMCISSIEELKKDLKDKDNKIKGTLDEIIKGFIKYKKESKKILNKMNSAPEKEGMFAKMMANMGIKKEVSSDNSDSHIAEVMIQGISMGSINMEKKIDNYEDKLDHGDLKYAKKFLDYEKDCIEKLKEYL